MKAVILAAGRGTRLAPLTDNCPKPMVPVAGRPLLLRTLERLKQAGIADRDTVIVTGYREDMVEALMRREGLHCKLVFNPHWFDWNSWNSLAVARPVLEGSPFIQLEGDVLFDEKVIPRLIAAQKPAALAVEFKPEPDDEAMKAIVDEDLRITALSKQLDAKRSIGEYVGVTMLSAEVGRLVFDDYDKFVPEGITHEYYDHSYHRLASRGAADFYAVDVADCVSIEIDDPDDLRRAEAMLAARNLP
jgi:choline kinase